MLEPIAGDQNIIQKVLKNFEDDSVGVIGPERWFYLPDKCNYPLLEGICDRLKIRITDQSKFIAGTMFWIKWSVLKKFVEHLNRNGTDLDKEYSLCEVKFNKNEIPTYMHSWERIYGYMISSFGYKIFGM